MTKEKIPQEAIEKLKEYSRRTGMKLEELQKLLLQKKDEYVKQHPRSKKTVWDGALRKVRGHLRRLDGSFLSPSVMFRGIICGDTGVIDFIEMMKRKATAMYNNLATREEAIAKHYVDIDGTPLDTRERVVKDGKLIENPNLFKPFPEDEHSYARTLYLICEEWGTGEFRFAHMNIREEYIDKLDNFDFNVPYKFRAILNEKGDIYKLNATKATDFVLADPFDLDEALENVKIYSVSEIDTLYGLHGKDYKNPLILKGMVTEIGDVNPKTQNRVVYLEDPDGDWVPAVRFFVPDYIPIDFVQDDLIGAIGFLSEIGQEGQEIVVINGYGYILLE